MKYTEQSFNGIFKPYLEIARKNYLKGKINISSISHFAKHFAVVFYNKKTEHLEFKEIEKNYTNGQKDMCIEMIKRIDTYIEVKQNGLNDYKNYSKATKKNIKAQEYSISELFYLKLIFESKLKSIYENEC